MQYVGTGCKFDPYHTINMIAGQWYGSKPLTELSLLIVLQWCFDENLITLYNKVYFVNIRYHEIMNCLFIFIMN